MGSAGEDASVDLFVAMSMGMPVVMIVVVTAMLVMNMAMIVRVIVLAMRMVMTVIVAAAMMATTVMAVLVMSMSARRFMRGGIGAAFGIERRLDLDDAGTETLHHLLNDVIAANPQALGHDLGRQVPVAEMPGEAHEMCGISAADLDQRFWRGHDFDAAAVFQHQGIATAQGDGVFEIEQEF